MSAKSFDAKDVEIVSRETVFQGFFRMVKVRLRHRLFNGGWGKEIERELFDKVSVTGSSEAVAALVYDPVKDLVGLVEQFRVGMIDAELGPWTIECVAGMVDKEESLESVMLRELEEEAGIVSATLLPITSFYPIPGSCNELVHLYCAICHLPDAGGVFGLPEEGEDILFSVSPAQEVFDAMLVNSRMNNAVALVGLQWLQLNQVNLREKYGVSC